MLNCEIIYFFPEDKHVNMYTIRSTNPLFSNEDTLLGIAVIYVIHYGSSEKLILRSLVFIVSNWQACLLIHFAAEWMAAKYVSGFPDRLLSDLCIHNLYLIQSFYLWDFTNIKFSFPNFLINWVIENRMDLFKKMAYSSKF